MAKILVSMIAYRERQLEKSVKDCYDKADHPENLIFSIVAEQSTTDLHASLDFIPSEQIIYRKYDLSEYRGVLWSRAKTTDVTVDYDYILYTCGHNLHAPSWDTTVLEEYAKALQKSPKVLITVSGPEYEILPNEESNILDVSGVISNFYKPQISPNYIPGYGFPKAIPIPDTDDVYEDIYWQGSWVFGPKKYVDDLPLDPDINYHAEEIYTTVKAWCNGWRFFATPKMLYYHDTYKNYPGEKQSRSTTHRPWSDMNKDAFWAQSDRSLIELNRLLSGRIDGVSKEDVLKYCAASGLDLKWCEYNENYHQLDIPRHAEYFRDKDPILESDI